MIVILLYLRGQYINVKGFLPTITLRINEHVYVKDPQSSDLGKRILRGSIELMDELGFEQFTFRKLAESIESTEASVYRYFESKHKLLLYLTSWYWSWLEYRLIFSQANIEDPCDRLVRGLNVLTEVVKEDGDFLFINEVKLQHIVISESSKAYLTREVDEENKYGIFSGYKNLVARVSNVILEINPNYKYPHMLVSTVIEGAHHQRYFAEHLPRLTDTIKGEDAVQEFYRALVLSAIQTKDK